MSIAGLSLAKGFSGVYFPYRACRLNALVKHALSHRVTFSNSSLAQRRFSPGYADSFWLGLKPEKLPSSKREVDLDTILNTEILKSLNIDPSSVLKMERGDGQEDVVCMITFNSSHSSRSDFLSQIDLLLRQLARQEISCYYSPPSNSLVIENRKSFTDFFANRR